MTGKLISWCHYPHQYVILRDVLNDLPNDVFDPNKPISISGIFVPTRNYKKLPSKHTNLTLTLFTDGATHITIKNATIIYATLSPFLLFNFISQE